MVAPVMASSVDTPRGQGRYSAYCSGTRHTMPSGYACASVDAWLQWFATRKWTTCRTYLCTRYDLDALDAEALMNAAQLQVFRHWVRLENPLAYFWQTLKHAVIKQGRRRSRERRQMAVYAQQYRLATHGAERTERHVTAVLEQMAPRQCQFLKWRMQGCDDTQIAAWLQTTPQAVRVRRYHLMRTLQAQLCPSGGHHHSRRPGGK